MEQLFWIVVSSVAPKQCCCASENIIYRKALAVASKRSGIHGRALLRSSDFTSFTKLYTFSCIMGFSHSSLVSLSDFHVVFQMQLFLHKKPLQTNGKDNKNYCRQIILHHHSIQQICSTKSRPWNCTL